MYFYNENMLKIQSPTYFFPEYLYDSLARTWIFTGNMNQPKDIDIQRLY
jgi:hypothetical protein